MITRLGCLAANRAALLRLNSLTHPNLNVKCSTKIESDDKSNKLIDRQDEVKYDDDDEDMPIELKKSPYLEEKPCCILCKYNLEVNYKNPRLLSQFVSNYTGLLYERNITGLCARQQEAVKYHIKVAHFLNLMPRFYKDPHYTNDPKLFNPFKPIRENNV